MMPSIPETTDRERVLALHDASVGAFEAARIRYEILRNQTESISLEYVCGRTDKAQVRSVVERYLTAGAAFQEASRRLQLSLESVRAEPA
jgi:hypothetical protein